jgi:hypothetical protein
MTETATSSPAPRTGILSSPPIRILLIAIVGFVLISIVSVVVYSIMRSSRGTPISYDVYPGAQVVREDASSGGGQQFEVKEYFTSDSIENVRTFYMQRLGTSEVGSGNNGCKDIFFTPQISYNPGDYEVRCLVDNSQDEIAHTLAIVVAHVPEGGTEITVTREWGG